MIGDFLKKLIGGEATTLPADDSRLALAVLMVRIARSDGHYAADEIALINALLGRHFALDAAGVEALRNQAEELEAQGFDTVRFTRDIKESIPLEDRLWVIEALWAIVLADGARAADEDSLLRLIASLLGISDQDSHRARQKVSNAS